MKKIFTTLLITVLTINISNAQYFSKDSVFRNDFITKIGAQDFEVHVEMVNPSKYKNYTWERQIRVLPSNWRNAICDPFLCRGENDNSGKFFTDSGKKESFIAHFRMDDNTGGYGSVKVILTNDTTYISDTVVLSLNIWNARLNAEIQSINDVFNIFPNPSITGKYTIDAPGAQLITVYNINGQEVLNQSTTNENEMLDLDISNLPNGLYLVKVKKENKVIEKKVIKG